MREGGVGCDWLVLHLRGGGEMKWRKRKVRRLIYRKDLLSSTESRDAQ